MNATERQLIRLLHGELDGESARRLEARLARDGALGARYRRLRRAWEDLEPMPAAAVPAPSGDPGFTAQVMAAARRETGDLSWALAPAWARAAAVAALVAGLALGASFGAATAGFEVDELDAGDREVYALAEPLSLAESYWLALDAAGGVSDEAGLPGDNGDERVQ